MHRSGALPVVVNSYTSFKCNPIERLFKWFRRVVTHNQFFESISDLKSAIRAFFRSVANRAAYGYSQEAYFSLEA